MEMFAGWRLWAKYAATTACVLLVLLLVHEASDLSTYSNPSIALMAIYFSSVIVIFAVFRLLVRLLLSGSSGQQGVLRRLRRKARIRVYARLPQGNASLGSLLDFGVTILSLGSCGMYVAETYMPYLAAQEWWICLEVVVSAVLFLEYLITMLIVNDPLSYIFSLLGVVNVVTVLPVFVHCWYFFQGTVDKLALASGNKLTYFRLLRLLRLMRILRALNIIHRAPKTDLRADIFYLVFMMACLIFGASGAYQWLENSEECYSTELWRWSTLDYNDDYIDMGCIHFHRALYYCTVTVLGRPRMVPEKESTFMMLVLLVCFSCFLIPTQLAKVWSTLQSTNRAQRTEYEPSARWVRHLVVVGHLEFASINMLLYEFFHPDRGDHTVQDVVLLFPNPPGRDVELLLTHPAYQGHVSYLQGSPLQERDLERASLRTAAGVIVLANKDSDEPRWHDGELLTSIQSMKAYWLKEIVQSHEDRESFTSSREVATRFLRPRIVAQVLLPETKEYLVELPGWTDHDVVVVCSEYVSWMLGMATLARGMATLVFNLTSHTETQRRHRTQWYQKYENGATQELYSIRLNCHGGSALAAQSMADVARLLMQKGIVLVAAERLRRTPHRGIHLFPGPSTFAFRRGDRILCIAKSQRELQTAVMEFDGRAGGDDASASRAQTPTIEREELDGPESPDTRAISAASSSKRSLTSGSEILTEDGSSDSDGEGRLIQQVSEISESNLDLGKMSVTVPRGCEDVAARTFSRHSLGLKSAGGDEGAADTRTDQANPDEEERSWCTPSCSGLDEPPAETKPAGELSEKEYIISQLRSRTPKWEGHIVLCGLPQTQAGRPGGRGLVTELIETMLRAHRIGPNAPDVALVCVVDMDAEERMTSLCLVEPVMRRMVAEGFLRAVSADPRNRDHLLLAARVAAARAVVALPEHMSSAIRRSVSSDEEDPKGRTKQKLVKQIVDTNTVITMQVARSCAERRRRQQPQQDDRAPAAHEAKSDVSRIHSDDMHCVTLLLQESTSNLFFGHANMRHLGAASSADPRWMDISPLNMSPLFASGELLAMTCFDRFAVEALFTPQVVPLIRMLIFGDRLDRLAPEDAACQGNRLHQIAAPAELVGLRWGQVMDRMVEAGQMPLGLLRIPVSESSSMRHSAEDTHLPYVMTNPDRESVYLRDSDLLFMVGAERPPSDSEDGGKGRSRSKDAAAWDQFVRTEPRLALSEEVQLQRNGTLKSSHSSFREVPCTHTQKAVAV